MSNGLVSGIIDTTKTTTQNEILRLASCTFKIRAPYECVKQEKHDWLKEGGYVVLLNCCWRCIIFRGPDFLSLLNLVIFGAIFGTYYYRAGRGGAHRHPRGTDLSAGRQVGLAAVVAAATSMENASKGVSGNGDHADCAGHPDCLRDWRGDWHSGAASCIAYLNVTPFITTL